MTIVSALESTFVIKLSDALQNGSFYPKERKI